jgi:hypothetical protein
MPSVTIDAGVLAAPNANCSSDDAYKYVDTLLDWSKLLKETWIDIYMSERASEALFGDDLYPLREHLKKIFNSHGIVEYDVNTVATIVDKLLINTPSFEIYFCLKDVLIENFETKPDIIKLPKCDELKSDLERCTTLIAILRKYCSQTRSHFLIIRETQEPIISVRAQVYEVEHNRNEVMNLPYPPDFFEGDILVCDDFKGLINCIDETSMLTEASDNFGIELSIRIALYKHSLAHGESIDWDNTIAPVIGSNFIETCQKCCTDQGASLPSKILRSIVETVNKMNLSDVHTLRTGLGGGDPQRMRGTDKAQRRDIDQEFHLHYWECADGKIELASVVYHNDFSIAY